MRPLRVMLVFGTRPEAIKMCPLVNELKGRPEQFETVVCVTGQHREMLDQVLRVFGVVPDHDLAIMRPGQTLFDVTCDVLLKLKPVLEAEKPDAVLVHGDTTTSFAAALACFYLQIPVGHVEAGLRTHDLFSPWPEEFNRQAVDLVTHWYFAPTEASKRNLLDEGKSGDRIWVTGNTGIDALRTTVREGYSHPELDWARGSRLILITAHRRENLGEPMHRMFRAIRRVMEEHPDTKAIYPIHMNPVVRKAAHEELDGFDRLHIIDPLEVLDFHNFLAASCLILTDSGGIQEEAPSLGKPVLVMRDTTERPEGVAAGTLKLVGTDEGAIYREFSRLLSDDAEYVEMSRASNPYGDGHASERIADALAEWGLASKPILTVFTPTYNRAGFLPRLYDSLAAQSVGGFEWLVVDDGSDDGTGELVHGWAASADAPFEIRYFYQENSGKHVAHNLAVKEARGDFFICVDSDDWLTPEAVETMLRTMPREYEAGVVFPRRLFGEGAPRETPWFPDGVDSIELAEMRFEYGLSIETAILFKTVILTRHPFPTVQGERFMSEELVYLDFPRGTRFLVRPFCFYECEYLEDGLTKNLFMHWLSCPHGAVALFKKRYEAAGGYRFAKRLPARTKALMNLSALHLACGEGALDDSPNKLASALLFPASFYFAKIRYGEALHE